MDKRNWTLGFQLISICLLTVVRSAGAQPVIFLVRHAEPMSEVEDAPLTELGQRRATALAALLKDAGINKIYTTDRRRSIQTAEPIARLLNIESWRLPIRDRDGLIGQLRAHAANDRVLVISHSLTVPHLFKALGHPAEISIAPKEFDNLFIILPRTDGAPLVLRLHY